MFGQPHHCRQSTESDQVRVIENRVKGMADSHYECSCQGWEWRLRKHHSSLPQEHSPSRHTHHPGGSRLRQRVPVHLPREPLRVATSFGDQLGPVLRRCPIRDLDVGVPVGRNFLDPNPCRRHFRTAGRRPSTLAEPGLGARGERCTHLHAHQRPRARRRASPRRSLRRRHACGSGTPAWPSRPRWRTSKVRMLGGHAPRPRASGGGSAELR